MWRFGRLRRCLFRFSILLPEGRCHDGRQAQLRLDGLEGAQVHLFYHECRRGRYGDCFFFGDRDPHRHVVYCHPHLD